jgi:hypothetical protein
MKKVVCINSKNYRNPLFDGPVPQEGDILTVSWEGIEFGEAYYQFAEYSQEYMYTAWRFAPLSDLDETELVTEEFEEKYCIPVKR